MMGDGGMMNFKRNDDDDDPTMMIRRWTEGSNTNGKLVSWALGTFTC